MNELWNFESVVAQEPLFAQTEFVVEADDFARQALYREHCETVDWTGLCGGYVFTVGKLSGEEINLSVNWVRIDGHVVMFFHCCSAVRDYRQVENWLQNRLPTALGKPEGEPVPSCFASGFDDCLEYCRQPVVKQSGEKSEVYRRVTDQI